MCYADPAGSTRLCGHLSFDGWKKSWLKFWVAMGMLDCDCGWFGVPGARVCSTIWTPARPTGETSDTRGVTRRVMDTPAFSPHNYYQIDDAPKATWRPKDISRKKHTSLSSDGRAPTFSSAHHKYQSVKNLDKHSFAINRSTC